MPAPHDPNSAPETTATSDATEAKTAAATNGETEQAEPPTTIKSNSGKVIPFTEVSISKLKRAEREKGALRVAKDMGFNSVEEMKAAYANRNVKPAAKPAPARRDDRRAAPAPARPARSPEPTEERSQAAPRQVSQREHDRLVRERAELEDKARRLAHEKARREKETRALRRDLDAKEAEMELKITAIQCGVTDPDYALTLLRRHLAGRPTEELAAFNERSFFGGLRKTHPVLFGETSQPATTGTGGSAEDKSKPQPPKQPTTPAGGDTVDARKMSPEDFNKLLNSRGLNNPNSGASY